MKVGSERKQKASQKRGQPNKGQRRSLSLWAVWEQRVHVWNRAGEAAEDAFLQCPLCATDTSVSRGAGAQPGAVQHSFSVRCQPPGNRGSRDLLSTLTRLTGWPPIRGDS